MDEMPVAKDPVAASVFDRILLDEQSRNAQRLNLIRVIGACVFFPFGWLFDVAVERQVSHPTTIQMSIYLVVSWVVFLYARRSRTATRLSRLAVPFLDMPVVFLIQWNNLSLSETPRVEANFTLALFVLLIMLSALSLERWQITVATTVAMVLQLALHWQAGETLSGWLSGFILLLGTTVVCEFARQRRMELVRTLCGEQLRRERLGRYFSPQVAMEIERTSDGFSDASLRTVSVLFSDLRDFTTLVERSDISIVVALLNDYFEHMVSVIFEHGGTLDKYIGDGLMVYFGAPVAQEDHAMRAMNCALAMQARLRAFNAMHQEETPLSMGIGIHSGPAVVGSIGAAHRREYTAIGDTVNVAARIEQLCKPLKETILVSSETRRLVGDAVALRALSECIVKGRTAPVQVYAAV